MAVRLARGLGRYLASVYSGVLARQPGGLCGGPHITEAVPEVPGDWARRVHDERFPEHIHAL